jgi:hypothetical protein
MRQARYGALRKVCRILIGIPEGECPLGRHRLRWEDNIRIDLAEGGFWGVDCIRLSQDRDQCLTFVNTVMNLRAPQKTEN